MQAVPLPSMVELGLFLLGLGPWFLRLFLRNSLWQIHRDRWVLLLLSPGALSWVHKAITYPMSFPGVIKPSHIQCPFLGS